MTTKRLLLGCLLAALLIGALICLRLFYEYGPCPAGQEPVSEGRGKPVTCETVYP